MPGLGQMARQSSFRGAVIFASCGHASGLLDDGRCQMWFGLDHDRPWLTRTDPMVAGAGVTGDVIQNGTMVVSARARRPADQTASRLRVKRAAAAEMAAAHPMRTRAATAGDSRVLLMLPVLVTATPAPAGSHLATSGATFCRIPFSMTRDQAMPPRTAATVLRVNAPRATPRSP